MSEEKPARRRTIEKPRKFYVFGPDVSGGGAGHGLLFENEKQLLTPPRLIVRPQDGGFPALSDRPRIVFDQRRGKPPRDLEGGLSGYWFISERLKKVFEEVDPEGFAFSKCDYILPDGSIGPTYFLCDVVRKLDAIDLSTSKVRIKLMRDHVRECDVEMYNIAGGGSLQFNEEVVGAAHVFIQPRLGGDPICDSVLRDSCKKLPALTGVSFDDAAKL